MLLKIQQQRKKAIKVSYYVSARNVTYQIGCKKSNSNTWKYIYVSKSSYKVKKLSSNKTYKFKLRAVKKVSGNYYYGTWPNIKKIIVK
ncbi:MAG: fibronectin type III domain-containing protein [Bacilli bacterium]